MDWKGVYNLITEMYNMIESSVRTFDPYFNDLALFLSNVVNTFISEVTRNPIAWFFLGIWYFAATLFFLLYFVTKNRNYILYGVMGYLLGTLIVVYSVYIL